MRSARNNVIPISKHEHFWDYENLPVYVPFRGYVQVESRVRINRPLVGVIVCCVVFWGLVIVWAVGR